MKSWTNIAREFLVPIGIGVLSVAGIVLIALIVFFDKPQASSVADPTATPFKYLFLATETHTPEPKMKILTPTASTNNEPSNIASTAFAMTPSDESSPEANDAPTATTPPAIDLNSVFIEGKYDDIDERVAYEGDWVNEIVETAYGESLFISSLTGDTAMFKFVGSQFHIGYLEDPGLGTINVSVDGVEYTLDQSTGVEWISPELPIGEHSVILTHESGDLIILDFIIIVAPE